MRKTIISLGLAGVVAALFVQYQSGAEATRAAPVPRPVSAADEALLQRAEQVLIRRCMARAGFDYYVVPTEADPFPFRYVLDDADWAAQHGYGTDLRRRLEARKNPNSMYFQRLSPSRQQAAVAALNGPTPVGLTARLPSGLVVQHSDRGCTAEAQRTLYDDLGAWYQAAKLVEDLPGVKYAKVTNDPQYLSGVRSWSECMAVRGHKVTDPAAAHARFLNPGRPSSRRNEMEFAAAEANCAEVSGLGRTARRLDAGYDRALRSNVRSILLTREELQRGALPAAQLIARSGDPEPHSQTAVARQIQ